MRAVSKTAGMRWLLSRVLTPLDLRLRNTRFAPSTLGMHAPLCYLTTTGRRSGQPRTVPLLYLRLEDDGIAVVATNFGTEHHPAWALNLEAEPRARIDIEGVAYDVSARLASDEESATLWPKFDRVWPGYEKYREIAPREIKVFVLRAHHT